MESPYKGKTGFKRLINAFKYSLAGLQAAFHNEDAFRLELLSACVLVPTAFYLEADMLSRALMIFCVFLLLIVELINSAIEAAVDRISLDDHLLAKRAKDIGSAAVFITTLNLVVVWGLLLFK
jgi:diacylglycerol kinase (ATP)